LALNSAFYKEHVGRDHLQRKFQSNQVFTPAKIDRCTISEDKYACISVQPLFIKGYNFTNILVKFGIIYVFIIYTFKHCFRIVLSKGMKPWSIVF